MSILIDAGNTRIKLGWLAQDTVTGQPPRIEHIMACPHADLPEVFTGWLRTLPYTPERALGVSVTHHRINDYLSRTLDTHGCSLVWRKAAQRALGLTNGYLQITQLGADRWAAQLGAWQRWRHLGQPLLLAGFGTATTLDTISPDGTFVGGLILPGTALMRHALAQGTELLPVASGEAQDYPQDTHNGIISGIYAAQCGALLRQWLLGLQRYGQPPHLVVTGGAWPTLASEMATLLHTETTLLGKPSPELHYHEHLSLEGVAYLLQESSHA